MLRAVPGAHRHLAAQHEWHVAVAAEHVACLADLIEELIGGDPHEVRVHELDDGLVAAIESDPSGEAGERVLTDGSAQHAVGKLIAQAAGGAVGSAVETMNVLAEDDNRGVFGHPAVHHLRYRLHELAVLSSAS